MARLLCGALVFLVFFFLVGAKETPIKNDKCKHCQFLADTFNEGLTKTANKHFAGGDTAWEEKNLGKYRTSETRLVEVMEGVCKKATLSNTDKFSGVKEIEFKCSVLLEDHEETIEEWYKVQETDLFSSFCVDSLRVCCPSGTWGESCSICPGVSVGAAPCFGRGDCHGSGSRQGTGKCSCSAGYTGHACSHCDANYFPVAKTETTIECAKCADSCAGGCSGPSAKDCAKCATGWTRDEQDGCIDVDECKAEGGNERCKGEYEMCINTPGSFRCDCEQGYVRGKEGACEVDVVAEAAKDDANTTVGGGAGDSKEENTVDGEKVTVEEEDHGEL